MYNEGDKIDIYADFSSFISPSDDATSPSKVTLKLDTGPDAHKTTINLTSSASLLLDESFGVPNTPNLNGVNDNTGVWDILELSNGDILIGGYFTSYEGVATRHLVLVNPDGTVKRTFGGSFSTNSPTFNGEVTSLTETSEGKIIVAGEFYNYNGNGNYDYLVQFNSDFSIDTTFMDKLTKNGSSRTFNAAIGEKNYAVYSPNSPVLEHDSKLYVTGNFTQVSGENHNKIVSLNLDGTINTGFTSPVSTNSNAQAVKTVRVDDNETATTTDDKLYITGYNPYVVYKGRNTARPIWRLNMDGTVDETFLSAVTSAFVSDVLVLPKSAQEGIVVSGYNMSIPGVSTSNVYALKKDGTHNKDNWATTSIRAGYSAEAFAIVEGKLFVGAHNRWPAAQGNGGLLVFNMEDGTVNQPFMKTLGSGKFVGGGTDVHALTLMKDGSLMVGGTFAGYNSQTNDERGIIRMRFNRLKGTYTVREEAKDLTGLMTVDSIESYQVDSIFGGAKDTTAPDLSTLPSGTLEKNTRYSLNRYPTDPVKTKLTVDKSKTPTTGQIVATVTSITEDDKYVGKSGDEVTFSVDNNLVSVTSVTDNKDGTYSVTLSTSETLETKTKISATVNGEAIQNNTSSPYQLEVTFEDVTKPTIQLSAGKTTLKKGESTTLTMVLSESSTNFALADLSAVGGVISGFSGSDKNYSATFTATDNFSGNGSVAIKADSFTDAAGNNNANQPSVAFTIDALSPTIAITAGKTALKAGEKTTVTFTLSEAATDFVQKDDITVTGGTLGTLSADAANKVYTAEFTPKANSTTDAVISVAADSFNDPAGNPNIVGASLTLSIDTVVPTVAISAGKTALKAGEKTTVTFTLSEAATDFTLNDDITVTGGSLGTLSADTAKKVYTAEFTPKAGSTADAVITVASDSFTDAAGNPNAAGASLTLTIDTVVPTVAITAGKTALKAGEKTTVTFTLSEAATDFVQKDDITVTGGTLGALSADTAKKVYTAEFTPTANSTKDAVITVASDSFSDAAGNLNAAGASLTLTIDTVVPTIAITADASSLKGGETAEVTFTLSEASTDFTSTDITVTGGTLGTLTGSGTTYTAEFTPKTNSDADGVIGVAASKFTDAAGNPNATGASLTLTIDTVVPTIEITSDKSALKRGEKATITFTLSKSASDFIASDITVTGGSLGTLTGTGTTYTAEFTPKVDSVANGVITVAANTFTDASGNQNATGHTLTISVDTVAPTIAITSDKLALKAGESAQITFTLSEAADDFKAEDVTTTGGTLGAVTGSGTSYSATFTPTASSTKNGVITVAASTFTDAAGNSNIKGDTLTLTVDSVVPTIAITSDKSALKAGETAQITFTLSESATDFVANDITVSGGTLGVLTGSGTSYSAEFTPSDDSTTAGVISVIANKFSDVAGNANSTGDSLTLTVDTVVPTISITSDKSTLKNGETATITFTLSESSTDFVANDVTVTGGALSGFTGTGKSYTATFTPKANSTDDGVVSVVGSKFSDAAGNLNTTGASVTLTIDSVLPGITITSDSLSLKNSETAEITFTLTKSASDFKAEDIEVEGGTLGTLTGSGKSYTATFTPTASSIKDGVISVGTSKFTDSAGNANAVGASLTLSIDTVVPTVAISAGKTALKAGEKTTVTFTLSEAATDFTLNDDITVTGGSLGTLSADTAKKVYTAEFTPKAGSTADAVITVASDSFTDAAGNPNAAGASLTLTIDTVVPTVAITAEKTALKAGEKTTVTFTLSEAATDFVQKDDITVTGGTLGALSADTAKKVYTAEFTPTANSTKDAVITVASDSFSDAAGNLNADGASLTLTIDTVVPTITITADASNLKGGETAEVTFTLSEASTDFTSTDITVTGGTLGTLTGSGTTYTAEFTPKTNSDADGVISVAASKFTDAAGNPNATGASFTLTIDTVVPTIEITSDKSALKRGEKATITFTLSKSASDFIASDITVTGGSLGTLTGTGTTYTAEFTPKVDSVANGVITVAANTFTDASGNQNATGHTLTISVDTVAPTIAITSDKSALKAGESAQITFTLSEAADDFKAEDVTTTGGTLGAVTGSGTSYSATFTPTASSTKNGVITVAAGTFTDAAGNSNSKGDTLTLTVDSVVPTIAITSDKSALKAGETAQITFTLSESATDFVANDITVSGGTLGALTGSGTSYSAEFTPSDDSTTAGVISVIANKFSDAAGNANSTGDSLTLTVDTVVPTISITSDKSTLKNGETATITFTLSESSTDFVANDVTVTGGALSGFTGTGKSYTATFTPKANSTDDGVVSVVGSKFSDAAGNLNTTGASVTLTIDSVLPGITITSDSLSLKNSETAEITFTLTKSASDFKAEDIEVEGGTLGTLTGSGKSYTAIFTPTASSTKDGVISVGTSKFTDSAGNANAVGASLTLSIDTLPPTISVSADKSSVKNGETAQITFTLSEASADFEANDISVTGGTLSTLSGSGKSYSITFTPTADSTTDGVISVGTNKFSDAAGNLNTSGASITLTVDSVLPTIDISSDKTALKAGEKAQITFTLSEAATDFASGDITVTGGSLGTLTGSGTSYSAEFTPTANSTSDGVISVAKSKFSDAAGNLNGAGDSLTLSIDSVVPTIAITADVSALKGGETAQVTFTLSEASTDFESADITVSGGTLGTLTGSGTTYSAEFTPTTNSNKSGVITVAASKFTDAAGNTNLAGASLTLAVDTVAPTISITSNKTQLKANETADITFKLSEASQDFVANDVTVSGGTLTDFDGSGDAYTAVFTPTSGSIANGVITVAASKFSDAAGNTNGAETKLTLTIDTVKPTIAITADKSKLKKGDTSTITIVLSEAATDFTVDDLVITVGSITSFTGSGKNYEAVVVPKDEFAGSVSLSVAEGKFTDAAGNNNVVSNTVTFDVNTKKPTTPTIDKSTTNINTPVLTGTSDAGNQVFVTINNVQFVTTATATTRSTAGKWTVDTANGIDSSGSPVDFNSLEDNRYDVELYAVDSFGNVSDEDATLDEVTIDTHRPNPPIFYPVTVQQVIKGLGEPQTKVSVKLANGAAVCAQQTIDEFGFWQCNPTVMLSDSQVVEATVTDSAGNTSLVAGTQVVSGAYSMKTTPAMLFNTLGKEVSGTGAFAADITVYDDANTTLCKTTVNPLGTWQCVLSANLAPNSKVNVLQFADQVAMNVFTHVIDPDNEWVPPTMYDVRSSLFEGESDYENGSVTIVNGEKICESTISKGYNNSELVNHFSCNASQSVDSTKLAFSFYSMAQKLQSSGLSTPVVVGGTIRDSDFDGRTDLEEWDCNNTGVPCIDTDGDGIPNYLDQDDDGDGIPSVLEQGSNYINTDSDNDGIPDSVESAGITPAPEMKGVDQDRDGIDDALDVDFTGGVDANGDGIDDRYQPRDTDGDGTPDYVDLDSDGDLIPDEVEGTADFDLDGLANYIDTDSDNDGISDQIEAQGNSFTSTTSRSFLAFANFITTPVNSDNDALPDYTDLDSDNDGIPDVIESGGKDEDNNAIADFDSPVITQPLDTDGDGEYDYLDLDSNDDGIFDIYESKGMTEEVVDQELDLNRDGMIDDTHVDSDSDGLPDIVDGFPTGYGSAPIDRANTDDFDNDGIPDSFDLDMDNDGIPNDIEGNMDTDGDGLIDAMDLDSDNDGIPDLLEHFPSFDTAKAGYIVDMIDLNGDGMDDRLVGKPLMDSDNDGVIDSQEIDSDNDGIPDLFEAVGINEVTLITNINRLLNGQLDEKADSDNDGIVDSIDRDGFGLGSNNYFAHALILADTDSDGLRDFQDKDSDNDGYSDKDEYLTDPNLGNNRPYEVTSMETAVSGHGAGGGGSLNLLTGLFVLMTLIVRSVSSMKNKVYILLGAGLALLTPMVHATTCGYLYEDGEFEGCWKLESGIGISRLAPEGESQGWYNESASYKPSWQVAVGYQLSPRWFAEARYAGLGDAKLVNKYSQSGVAAFEGEESISYYVPSIALGSYFYPYTTDRKWNVYGKIGASSMFNSTSDDRITFEQKNKVQVNFGGGVEYRPTNSAWFFKLEGISYDSDALNTSLLIGRYFGGDKEQPKSKVEQQLDTIEERIIDLETKVDVIPATEEKTIVVENFNSNSVVDFFKSDSSVLGENGKRELQTLAEKVLSKSDYHVKIYGHTDATGSDEYNQRLSQRRADSAKAYLTSLGLNPDLVEAIGLGESSPIASNDNQQGRSLNRRVNIESSWVE
ncbi:Ig-like domain-containing protein [Vibrio sp. NTOU-M3]|uniref:Ig-like domain-containing protein n=1 Tax=Vibrio sp. NTOU-M3 TaxID=3234954 RepID=UPI00349FB361